jgi:hypothetical protein
MGAVKQLLEDGEERVLTIDFKLDDSVVDTLRYPLGPTTTNDRFAIVESLRKAVGDVMYSKFLKMFRGYPTDGVPPSTGA